ncbi:MAG: hypothetical protein JNK82_33670 [Myxococcaceae bacterium]|nr:hypothetical protein [Myxococcaceae bacterium]
MNPTLLLVALSSGVAPGGTLYVKGTGVTMWSKADATGTKTALRDGDAVVWRGADARNPGMHAVELSGKQGFVPQSALTPNKPDAADRIAAQQPAPQGAALVSAPSDAQKGLALIEAASAQAGTRVAAHVKQQQLGGDK